MSTWGYDLLDRPDANSSSNDYSFDFIKWETEKAWLVVMDGKELWFPKSCCSINARKKLITVPDWLATEKEIV